MNITTVVKKIFDYFQNNLGVQPNAMASILLSILTFSLGYLFNWVSRIIGRKRDKRNYRKSFKFTLLQFSSNCNSQWHRIQTSLLNASLLENKNFIIQKVPMATLNYLVNTDYNTYIKTFRPKWYYCKKGWSLLYRKATTTLFDLIARINNAQDDINQEIEKIQLIYHEHEKSYNENIAELKYSIVEYFRELRNKGNIPNDQLIIFNEYNIVYTKWHENGAKTGFIPTYDEIVKKILDLNNKYPLEELTSRTNKLALACDLAYINVQNIDNMLTDRVRQFALFNKKASKLTRKIIEII